MATVKPFKGVRPPKAIIEKLACLPYDVMNTEEAAKMAAGKPESLLHVTRAEIDCPAGTDPAHFDSLVRDALARCEKDSDALDNVVGGMFRILINDGGKVRSREAVLKRVVNGETIALGPGSMMKMTYAPGISVASMESLERSLAVLDDFDLSAAEQTASAPGCVPGRGANVQALLPPDIKLSPGFQTGSVEFVLN